MILSMLVFFLITWLNIRISFSVCCFLPTGSSNLWKRVYFDASCYNLEFSVFYLRYVFVKKKVEMLKHSKKKDSWGIFIILWVLYGNIVDASSCEYVEQSSLRRLGGKPVWKGWSLRKSLSDKTLN